MTLEQIAALIVFALTYAMISMRRFPLGRPAAATIGAVLMVAIGIVTPSDAYREAVDGNTIVLLLGMMILTEHLREAGFFRLAARWTFRVADSPRSLLFWLAWTSGVLSALFVNDTVCLLMTPLVAQVLAEVKLPRFPYLMTLATASNIGSVMTLTGNPQNMIIGSLAQKAGHAVDYPTFALHLVPVGIICLVVHVWFLQWLFRKELPARWQVGLLPEVKVDRLLLQRTLLVLLGVGVAFFLKLNPAWSALAGACVLFTWNRRGAQQVLEKIDWSLLLFFCGLFVSVYGLKSSGLTSLLWEQVGDVWETGPVRQKLNLVLVGVLGSNVVSNVPFINLVEPQIGQLVDPSACWMLLALATTFAGNLTLLGSVANVIVMETSGEPVGFWQYLRVGLPVTVLSCVVGTAILLATT